MPYTLLDGLFIGFDDQFGMLRLLVRIINAGKARDFPLVNQFIQAFDVALAAGDRIRRLPGGSLPARGAAAERR